MTKRVAITINTSWNIAHFRAGLIAGLKAAGYEVISAAPPDAYSDRLRGMVTEHTDLSMDNAGTSVVRDALLTLRYYRWLKRTRPDALLTYTIKPNIYATLAARMLGIPVIANVAGLGTAFIHPGWVTHLVMLLYRLALTHPRHVFFQNPEDRELFIARGLVGAEKTSLLAGSGVDLSRFKPVPKAEDGTISFILVARLLADKGIREYVEAARAVKATHPNSVFRLLGPRGVRNQTAIADEVLDGWIREGVIEYLGESDAVETILAEQDCVVLPSYREGMPRSLLEAAAMGKPMIATDVPGCRHVVHEGVNGLLCRVRDAEDLARTIREFIALPLAEREAMGRASRALAEREFDESRVVSAYLEQIKRV